MKIQVAKLFDAFVTLVAVINEKRPLPQVAQYRLARMYEALRPEVAKLEEQRIALVREFGEDEIGDDGNATGDKKVTEHSPRWSEFVAAWEPITREEIEVVVEPVALSALGSEGHILATELLALGSLVKDA